MNKILVALDYGPTTQKVAEMTFSHFDHKHTEITLLHVVGNPAWYASTAFGPIMGFGGYANLDLLGPGIMNELKIKTKYFLEKTKDHLGNDSIKTLVKEGSVGESILTAAKELNVDAIAMGSHSQRWLENILMGSITEYVLHHTTIPLFIIPTKKQRYYNLLPSQKNEYTKT
jgi:nucleotide-binding universal stress UspA family protein